MCGIAAIFSYRDGRPVSESELLATSIRKHSRGTNVTGIWITPVRSASLAHRRLSILDLSPSGAQPMFDETGAFGISFNGEIYNYRELRAELEKKGFHFRSTTDTEVLLHLYADRGVSMLDSLRGMYAFALWDERKKALLLARDPYGIKPLYYSDNGTVFRAASQVKALLAGGNVDTTANPAGHVGFFLWGHVPDPHTLYRGIRALPAGSFVWVQRGKSPSESIFCSIPKIFAGNGDNNGRGSVKEIVREALHDSVRRQLIADVPVGVFLSSGVDSTIIAALAAEEGGSLQTVTLGFDEYKGTPNDEAPLAEEVARLYGSDHQTVRVTRRDFENRFDHLLWSMDQPTTDGINSYWVSYAAKESGLKVARSRLACLESCWYMRNQLLRDSDWAGMAHSLEIRVPLVDIELLRSTGKWIGNGHPPNKRMMLHAPLWPLPDDVFSRPKTGFTVPIRQWLPVGAVHERSECEPDRAKPVRNDRPQNHRGLRAWANVVYSHFTSSAA